ncbi:hypothetical protein Anas_06840 [Armadillidium nasatum]|uniref:Uncharacterized protein n=1 Tax=Armadillidium nasatum TaxID=96803 RepID=A0A5N5TEF4_9CRUS|nr:hypothetical protein Anas_06840 [Armadillidium nasatum]
MRPLNESVVTLENLLQEGLYIATLYAGGERAFITELLDTLVFTLKTESPLSNINSLKSNLAFGDMKVPSLVLLISSLSGTSLLVVNVALITCYLRSKRSRKGTPSHTVKETSRNILQPDNLPPDIYTPVKKSKFETETSSSETDGVYRYKRKYSSTDSIYDNTSLTLSEG